MWIKNSSNQGSGDENIEMVTEITIPGPQQLNGKLDDGGFSIKNNVSSSLPFIIKWINKRVNHPNNIVNIKIKGHSRGGVAANIILNKLSNEFKGNSNVRICSVNFDPVPGHSLLSDRSSMDADNYKKMLLHDKVEGAVLYSINSGYPVDFNSQKIYNYPVTIISELKHDLGLYQVTEGKGKKSKKGYKFNAKTYKPGQLYELPKGTYWANEGFKITEININNYKIFIDNIESKGQKNRKNFLKNLIYNRIIEKKDIDNILTLPNQSLSNEKYLQVLCEKLKNLQDLFYKDKKISDLIEGILVEVKEIKIPEKIQNIDNIVRPIETYSQQIKNNGIKKYFADNIITYIRVISKGTKYF